MNNRIQRLALFGDYREEGWPSMDLAADMLYERLAHEQNARLEVSSLQPAFRRRLQRISRQRSAFNADRLMNRFWDYPRFVRGERSKFDLFHVCDHSYAQLVHPLPAQRTGVYCHDIDAFRCLTEPHRHPRPFWFRSMTRRILDGLQKAAVVFHSTMAVRAEIERFQLVEPARLIHAPYGIAAEFTAEATIVDLPPPLKQATQHRFLLHVGSCIPRKRIDVLLESLARVAANDNTLRLIQIGGEWSGEQAAMIKRLGIENRIVQTRGIDRMTLACLYRSAAIVLQPSEAEGFGLPVVEAIACGATVIASELPVFRELAGSSILYCPIGSIEAWSAMIRSVLDDPSMAPPVAVRLERASRFSWSKHAATIADAYLALA